MKFIAVNGSPRRQWNTSQLAKAAADGAASCEAETQIISLYEYSFKGCVSCFACKLKTASTRENVLLKMSYRLYYKSSSKQTHSLLLRLCIFLMLHHQQEHFLSASCSRFWYMTKTIQAFSKESKKLVLSMI